MKKLQQSQEIISACQRSIASYSKSKDMLLGPALGRVLNNEAYQNLVGLLVNQPHLDLEKLLNDALLEKIERLETATDQSPSYSLPGFGSWNCRTL
jgi:hypothetical protein